jgi:hypothetical protein
MTGEEIENLPGYGSKWALVRLLGHEVLHVLAEEDIYAATLCGNGMEKRHAWAGEGFTYTFCIKCLRGLDKTNKND